MACADHVLLAFVPPAHEPAAQAALPLEALLVEANDLQPALSPKALPSEALPSEALPSKAMCAITRATYDPSVEVPRHLHRPARERVFIRMVIPAMRAQTCRAFLFVLPFSKLTQ